MLQNCHCDKFYFVENEVLTNMCNIMSTMSMIHYKRDHTNIKWTYLMRTP